MRFVRISDAKNITKTEPEEGQIAENAESKIVVSLVNSVSLAEYMNRTKPAIFYQEGQYNQRAKQVMPESTNEVAL